MGPRSVERGNVDVLTYTEVGCDASMGPRSVERGNHETVSVQSRGGYRFNGATLGRAWKPLPPVSSLPPMNGFNGATLGRAWKRTRSRSNRRQRGSFNGATLGRAWKRAFFNWAIRRRYGFNGATLGRAWKRRRARRAGDHVHASMGPRSVERGNSGD